MEKSGDYIKIQGLQIFAHHGVFDVEKEKGQHFVVDAILYTDLRKAGDSDDLNHSTNYGEVSHQIKDSLTRASYDLIEKAATRVVEDILLNFPLVERVTLELSKPQAPIDLEFETVSVCLTRGWKKVYVAFGSNMGEPGEHIRKALKKIEKHPLFRRLRTSNYFTATPYGGVEQEDFVNGVLEVETLLTSRQLLNYLHQLEEEANRVRQVRWGPRTLDLDILFYGKEIVEEEDLIIPHKDMGNRDFVLIPLMQLAPHFRHPITGKRIEEMAEELTKRHVIGGACIPLSEEDTEIG